MSDRGSIDAFSGAPARQQPPAPQTEPAVLLVDDHDLFRAGLRQLLEGQRLRVVGDARCEPSALDMARRTRATIAVFDTQRTDGSATDDLIARLTVELPEVGVVVFTRSEERVDLYRSIRAGARGYVNKAAPIEHLASAIRSVHVGDAWLHPRLLTKVLELIRTGNVPTISRADMSDREIEVLRLVADGLDNNDIAAALGISAKTVKNHVSSILAKLQLTNRVQAAAYAIRTGIA